MQMAPHVRNSQRVNFMLPGDRRTALGANEFSKSHGKICSRNSLPFGTNSCFKRYHCIPTWIPSTSGRSASETDYCVSTQYGTKSTRRKYLVSTKPARIGNRNCEAISFPSDGIWERLQLRAFDVKLQLVSSF